MSKASDFRVCAIVPTYENPLTVERSVDGIRAHGLEVVLVDDCSGPEAARICSKLARDGRVELVRRDRNGGKGAAVKDGLAAALELGYTHAFQIDADGQHDLDAIPAFIAAARADPSALVLGEPRYDMSAPRTRTFARGFMLFWVGLETGRRDAIHDAMIGFRIYPIEATLAARARGDRMEFDVEILVRLLRRGIAVVNLPVGVRYVAPEDGGVSHFKLVQDNVRFSWMHCRLCTAGLLRWIFVRPFVRAPRTHEGVA